MSYVTAMLRRRARMFAEESRWWKREANDAGEVTRRRIVLAHDFAAVPCEDYASLVDITTETLRVDEARPRSFLLHGIQPRAALQLADLLDAIFIDCAKRRVVPYRARAREIFERADAALIEILSLSVPTQGGRR